MNPFVPQDDAAATDLLPVATACRRRGTGGARLDSQGLMTVADVAKRLRTSISFIYARIADGSLAHYRLGDGQGGLRISNEQLNAYLRARLVGPTAS